MMYVILIHFICYTDIFYMLYYIDICKGIWLQNKTAPTVNCDLKLVDPFCSVCAFSGYFDSAPNGTPNGTKINYEVLLAASRWS